MPVYDFEKPDTLELEGVPADMLTIGSTPDYRRTVLALSDGRSLWRVYLANRKETEFLIRKLQDRLKDMPYD